MTIKVNKKRISCLCLSILLIPLSGLCLYYWLSRPIYNGTLYLNHISSNTTIKFEEFGIPSIYSDDEVSVSFGLGELRFLFSFLRICPWNGQTLGNVFKKDADIWKTFRGKVPKKTDSRSLERKHSELINFKSLLRLRAWSKRKLEPLTQKY